MSTTRTPSGGINTISQDRGTRAALADCAQARKDLDAAHNVHYATVAKALETGTSAKHLAEQLRVTRSAIYQMAAKGNDLDPELFPPAQDELITLPFGPGTEQVVIPALLGSRTGIDSAEHNLRLLAARARDTALAEIAATVGCSAEAVNDLVDRHDRDDCWNCGQQNGGHAEAEKALCQEQLLDPGEPQPPPTKASRDPPQTTQPPNPTGRQSPRINSRGSAYPTNRQPTAGLPRFTPGRTPERTRRPPRLRRGFRRLKKGGPLDHHGIAT